MDVYTQISHLEDFTYKLVQLPLDLLQDLRHGNAKTLEFKAPKSASDRLALCTEDKTFNVRQMNHSNTVLLVSDMATNGLKHDLRNSLPISESTFLGVGSSSYVYELKPSQGTIDTTGVSVYDGGVVSEGKSLDAVISDSPIARANFKAAWHEILGSEVGGYAVVLDSKFTTKALYTLISATTALKSVSSDIDEIVAQCAAANPLYTRSVVETLYAKFGTSSGKNQFSEQKVAAWFGIDTLKRHSKAIADRELLLEWKAAIPPFYKVLLSVSLLRGSYCRPSPGMVRYVASDSLSTDLHGRIKEMLLMAKEWDFDDMFPFLKDYLPAGKKPESVILKYARRKRQGKKTIVFAH